MLDTKMFELRDMGTFIPIMGIRMWPTERASEAERYLLRRAGFSNQGQPFVVLLRADTAKMSRGITATYNPYEWQDRTYHTAHKYITDNWDSLKDGQVVCVEFILNERTTPKESESKNGYF